MRWKIEGFESDSPTEFTRQVLGSEAKVKILLQRLVARHLTADEIVHGTFVSGTFFSVNRDKRIGKPVQLMTTGNPYYVATEVRDS